MGGVFGSPLIRLTLGLLLIAAAFSGGSVLGQAVGPILPVQPMPPIAENAARDPDEAPSHAEDRPELQGLSMSRAGYSLSVDTLALTGVPGEVLRFRVVGPDGTVAQHFRSRHERELHLILVRRDLASYAHLHPLRDADGWWSVGLPELTPGSYRALAGFAIAGGPDLTLGVDLVVPGEAGFTPLPEPADTALVDGFVVGMIGTPTGPGPAGLVFGVARDGVPVPLDPYLGADGHLVALRAGDLGSIHAHPEPGPGAGAGAGVRFTVDLPDPGDYRLFFEFSHGGVVRTAAFTVRLPAGAASATATTTRTSGEAP